MDGDNGSSVSERIEEGRNLKVRTSLPTSSLLTLSLSPLSPPTLHSSRLLPWPPPPLHFPSQDFLQKLKTYDKDNIPPKIIAVIRTSYLTNENFTPDTAKKASPAAEVRSFPPSPPHTRMQLRWCALMPFMHINLRPPPTLQPPSLQVPCLPHVVYLLMP